MGYPTSVFTPAVRSNGQTIDASHVNDLQTEVTALENAILGTITHSVNVSGASTLATLQATASTFSVRPITPPPDAAKVFLESTGAIASSVNSVPSFTGQAYLTNSSIHSTSVNPQRLTPQSTGVYQFTAQFRTDTPSSGGRTLFIVDSSNSAIARQAIVNSTALTLNLTGYKRYDVLGGYASVLFSADGTTHSMSSGVENTWFAMHKL